MAKFLSTRATTAAIENIINNATKSSILISPFVKIPESLFQNLKIADQQGKSLTLVYGKQTLEPNVTKQLTELKNLKLYYLDNLHGKCYFNERSMVITSLNLYDYSEQNNRELGVHITRQDDEEVFSEAVREANMIISLATRSDSNLQLQGNQPNIQKQLPVAEKEKAKGILFKDISEIFTGLFGNSHGFCISCGTSINFNENRPYCPECYFKWTKHKWQKAKYCHECGKRSVTSMNKPFCRSCYEKLSVAI